MTRPRSRHLVFLAGLATLVLGLPSSASAAEECDRIGCGRLTCASPATPPPSQLWGDLQPVGTSLPPERDTTNFNEFREAYYNRNWFFDVDIENGFAIVGLAHGIGVWDLRSDPANPTVLSAKRYTPVSGFPYVPGGEQSKIVFGAVDAPAGVDTVAAIAGYGDAGIVVFDLSDKTQPRPVYQDTGKGADSIYAATIQGRHYAFLPTTAGLFVYDLSTAVASNPCTESAFTPAASTCGVMKARIDTGLTPYFVHGVDNYLVVSFGSSKGFRVYDISNPAAPQVELEALTGGSGRSVTGVAMWKQGGQYYVGARGGISASNNKAETLIYNVSCVTGTCGSFPLLSQTTTQTGGQSEYLSFSRSGATPFLYAGSDANCNNTAVLSQREYLLDVSNPSDPVDVTPGSTLPRSAIYNGVNQTKNVNYWSWYYRESPTGFNLVAPRHGEFHGEYFFRAGRSVFDVHRLTVASPPTADFDYPAEIYAGTPTQFTDTSTGSVDSWSWSFQDGSPGSSPAENPAVSFVSPGPKLVSLTAGNGVGSDTHTESVTVLNPAPAVSGVVVSPAAPTVCQPVSFSATGVTGRPTLGYAWSVQDAGSVPMTAGSGTGLTWSTGGLTPAGTYTASVTITNTAGSANATVQFPLAGLQPLPAEGGFTPTHDPFVAGTVNFHVSATGATEWNWDFGDGAGFTGWTNDPVTGPNPVRNYLSIGTKNVRVMVRNCVTGAPTSATLPVTITQVTPLVAGFQATGGVFCSGLGCSGDVNTPITFTDQSSGDPNEYAYAWTNTNSSSCSGFGAGSSQPATSHTYVTTGIFYPCLRVTRGVETETYIHRSIAIGSGGGGGGTSSISVSGPSSGSAGANLAYNATASGCTPASTWAWTATGGGTVTGNGSSVTINWSSAGGKTVSVTNTGCPGKTGTRSVSITTDNSPLAAGFTYSPAAPIVGQAVFFDSATSTGAPQTFEWTFGDGAKATTASASHAFTQAGVYNVKLIVLKPGPCLLGMCFADITKPVVVTDGQPPVAAAYDTSASCETLFGFTQCTAQTGTEVTFTSKATGNPTALDWDFGDNAQANGSTVKHTFTAPGVYLVLHTATRGSSTATAGKTFFIEGQSAVATVILPWINAQTTGVAQSSRLFVHNPGPGDTEITLTLRRRGSAVKNPPQVVLGLAEGETRSETAEELFGNDNVTGFVQLEGRPGDPGPLVVGYHTTTVGSETFAQMVPGIPLTVTEENGEPGDVQHLVGLAENDEWSTIVGITNAGNTKATYHLRIFDSAGRSLYSSERGAPLALGRFGQKQYLGTWLRANGVVAETDFRIEIVPVSGGPLYGFAASLRRGSDDPSFVLGTTNGAAKQYLLGVLNGEALLDSVWSSDVVLVNPSEEPMPVTLKFLKAGAKARPLAAKTWTLAPGESMRLADVLREEWSLGRASGLLIVESAGIAGQYPLVLGETYQGVGDEAYGQTMAAQVDALAATPEQSQELLGLTEGDDFRTEIWLFNPTSVRAQVRLVYRNLDGEVLGTRSRAVPRGKAILVPSSQHSLGGEQGAFSVEVEVLSGGTILSGAQVINLQNNDPAYVSGWTRE
jgi:PKD repeat protein